MLLGQRLGITFSRARDAKARTERKEVALDPKWGELYSGNYKIKDGPAAGMVITIERHAANFVLKDDATPPEGLQLHAENEQTFFTTAPELEITFQKDDDGKVSNLKIRFAGTETIAPRMVPQ